MSIYDHSVPFFAAGLHSHRRHLELGSAYAKERGFPVERLLEARLFPDMFSLTQQTQTITDSARRGCARLAAQEPPSVADDEKDLEALLARIDRDLAYLDGLDRASFEGAETREIVLNLGEELRFTGRSFLQGFAIPNFMFHVTTAYNVLRANGVPLGKRPFLESFIGSALSR